MAGEANRQQHERELELVQLEQATAMVSWMEPAMAARRWEAAAEEGTAVAVMGIHGAERAAGPSPAGAAGLEAVTGLDMVAVTVEATEGERLAEEATMPAAAATAAMVQEAAAMAPVKGTPEVGYLPAGATSPEAKNGMTRRPAERRRTTSTGKPAAAGLAAPAAARSPPAARRTPPAAAAAAAAAEAGRDPRSRSPSAPPRATASTAAVSRARAGRGSAAPRRRPDLPPAGRSRQLSGLRATDEHAVPPPESRGSDTGASRSRPPHASSVGGARQITPRWTEAARPPMGAAPPNEARGSYGRPETPRSEPPPAAASPPAQCSAMQRLAQLSPSAPSPSSPLASLVRLSACLPALVSAAGQ